MVLDLAFRLPGQNKGLSFEIEEFVRLSSDFRNTIGTSLRKVTETFLMSIGLEEEVWAGELYTSFLSRLLSSLTHFSVFRMQLNPTQL